MISLLFTIPQLLRREGMEPLPYNDSSLCTREPRNEGKEMSEMRKKMMSCILSFLIFFSMNFFILPDTALACAAGEDVKLIWSEDFDTGYAADAAVIQGFDVFDSISPLKDGVTAAVPDYWNGTYNFLSPSSNYDAKVVRKVEDGNGMLSFQHVGSSTTEGIYVQKSLGVIEGIPRLTLEYRVRATKEDNTYWSFYLLQATSSDTSRLRGPQFRGYDNKIQISNSDNDFSDNPGFATNEWVSVKVVYDNKSNTRDTYIQGEYVGTDDNPADTMYWQNGKATFNFQVANIANTTTIDLDDIRVTAEAGVTVSSLSLIQGGMASGTFEISDEPASAVAAVGNLTSYDRDVSLYLAAYAEDADGMKSLQKITQKRVTVKSESSETIETDGILIPEGVTQLKVFVWDEDNNPLCASETFGLPSYEASLTGIADFSRTESLGNTAYAQKVTDSATGLTKLGYRTYFAFMGTPTYIFEYDTLTGDFINKFEAGSGMHQALCVGSDGKLYHIPYNSLTLYVYDPETQTNTKIAKFSEKSSGINWELSAGADGDNHYLYSMTHNYDYKTEGHYCIEYNVDTGKIKTYTGIAKNVSHAHGATGNDKYIFVSAGSAQGGDEQIIRIDKTTGEQMVWQNDTGNVHGNLSFVRVAGGKVFTQIHGTVVVLDADTMEKVGTITDPSAALNNCRSISYPKPDGDSSVVYYMGWNCNRICSYNLSTGVTQTVNYFNYPYSMMGKLDFGTWVQKKDGTWVIAAAGCTADPYRMTLISPGDAALTSWVPTNVEGVPTAPHYMYVSRDDILYTGGYEAGLSGFDLNSRQLLFSVDNGNQHGMTMTGGKLFGGTYASGNIYMYDPEKEADIKQENPKIVMSGQSGVMRHYYAADTNAGFGLISGIADYGGTEGGVFLCTYRDGAPDVKYYGGVIPGENIIGVAYKDGYIYAGSTVHVSALVNEGTAHEEAHIAKIDAKTGETVSMMTIDGEALGLSAEKVTMIGEIAFGPDGLLYGALNVDGAVVAVDTDTMTVQKCEKYYPNTQKTASVSAVKLIFGADGVLYTNLNTQIQAINIETMEKVTLYSGTNSHYLGMDNDGNLLRPASMYFPELIRMVTDQRQRLNIMIENAKKYYKEEKFSPESWQNYQTALAAAENVDLNSAYATEIKSATRQLTFAIKDLQTVYDAAAGFGYPFDTEE